MPMSGFAPEWTRVQILPDRTDAFARFIAVARQSDGGLLLLGACLFLILAYVLGSGAILGLLTVVWAGGDWRDLEQGFGAVSTVLGTTEAPLAVVMLLTTFFAMGGAVWATARLFHDRGLRSLLGPGPHGRSARITALVCAGLLVVAVISGLTFADPKDNLALGVWLAWMPIALPLLLVQVSAEELIFRGYLMQELAARYSSRWIWLGVPTAVFGLLHFDPGTHGSNALLVCAATALFGLIAADLTVRTGTLVPAILLHFTNNFFALFILSLDGTINGMSLFVTGIHASDTAQVRFYLLIDIAVLVLLYAVWIGVRARLHSEAPHPMSKRDPEGTRA